jgi:aromatic ring-opening dioxygenase LigB subunit
MKKQKTKLEDYAAKPVLILSGSLLVLSIALNNIGFKEVVDAYAKLIVSNIENKNCKAPEIDKSIINQINQNSESIKLLALDNEILKENSHSPTK